MVGLLVTSLLWAFSFGLIKRELVGVDPGFVAFVRLGLALMVFAPFLRRGRLPAGTGWRLAAVGAVQLGLMYVLYIASYRYLAAHEVAVLTALTPLHVVLVDMAWRRRWVWPPVLAALLAVVGAGVVTHRGLGSGEMLKGVVLVQLANLCFGGGQVAYRRVVAGREVSHASAMAALYLGATALTASIAAATVDVGAVDLTPRQAATLLYLGLLPSGLGFFLWNRGATRVGVGMLAVFNNVKAPLAVVVALVVFGEQADGVRLAVGSAAIVAALLLAKAPVDGGAAPRPRGAGG